MTRPKAITFDELLDAVRFAGDATPGGACAFDPARPSDPDHHGPEYAEAIWAQVELMRAVDPFPVKHPEAAE